MVGIAVFVAACSALAISRTRTLPLSQVGRRLSARLASERCIQQHHRRTGEPHYVPLCFSAA
jgi:hypothetical protein